MHAQVLGEYAHLKEDLEPAAIVRLLAKLLAKKNTSSETKSWVVMAMSKLCEGEACTALAQEVAETCSGSMDTGLRQRVQELQHVSQDSHLRDRLFPRDAGVEPLEVKHSRGFRKDA